MIDRLARDLTIEAIEAFLDDRITAFEFDDQLLEIETKDRTVDEIAYAAWFHYDDIKDHKVRLSKAEWDYFQRLLLLLRSDMEFTSTRKRRWGWDHALACIGLASFLAISYLIGWGYELFLVAAPFGILSIFISRKRDREKPISSMHDIAHAPFTGFSQIRWLRKRVPTFIKQKYRTEIGERFPNQDYVKSKINSVFEKLVWIFFSPIALLFQGIPSVGRETLTLFEPRVSGVRDGMSD